MIFPVSLPNAVQLPWSQELEMCHQMLGIKENKQICVLKKEASVIWDGTMGLDIRFPLLLISFVLGLISFDCSLQM